MKAWVDIYLLSMRNKLVTSSKSKFGYVAAGLDALRPWIVMNPDHGYDGRTPEPSYERGRVTLFLRISQIIRISIDLVHQYLRY
ncbi:Galactoside 2-alpha-L-fucosyltransferase [Linum grandiflorum]